MVIAKWGIIPPLHISIHKNNVMDCLIYFRIDNAAIRTGMYNELKLITPNVRYKHYLIKIEGVDVFGSTSVIRWSIIFIRMNYRRMMNYIFITGH